MKRLSSVSIVFRPPTPVPVTRRPKYACRTYEDGVLQALIEGGLPTKATVAQVLVSKYADHLPLYRQAQIYARKAINLDRSTLADWVGHPTWHLRPLQERLPTRLKASGRLFAVETTAPALDPCRGAPRLVSSVLMPPTIGRGGLGSTGRLRAGPQVRTTDDPSRRFRGYLAGRRLCRLPQAGRSWRRPVGVLLVACPAWLL